MSYIQGQFADDFNISFVQGKYGSRLRNWLSLEMRAGVGVQSDKGTLQSDAGELTAEIDPGVFFGAFVKLDVPLQGPLRPYVMGGWNSVSIESKALIDAGGSTISGSENNAENGMAWGAGVSIDIGQSFLLELEYSNIYRDDDDVELENIGLGLVSFF